MPRIGCHKPLERLWSFGVCIARVLAILAAVAMATGVAVDGRAQAGLAVSGIEMVICSSDGPVSVMLDHQGNPVKMPDDGDCACLCACCPTLATPFLAPAATGQCLPAESSALVCPPLKSTVLAYERGRRPVPRGPPFEKES
ncbi:DUF2946 family protein [Maliponia aquimaris]|uniref:DUF2946 domain-containing protein n=1 Tax=Maliponia aquimaris TaxID=1673631 RepID=A0A238L2W8_9RHOB|nr:DUF2946 family protein [Maliponia aquimaris]SMX49327.1 hypothetical protein MAA8898_04270 [Maliponia aquimaris]